MKNLLNEKTYSEIKQRIDNLSKNGKRKWGKMSMEQMLAHCADQIRLALGEKPATEKAKWFQHYVTLPIALALPRLPRLKFQAPRDMNAATGEGTKATDFTNDRQLLLDTINRYYHSSQNFQPHPHPKYGTMNRRQWGHFMYIHLDHHLRQFSC